MKRILVIDDDSAVRESFVAALECGEYAISSAASGLAGVESARRQCPDLVFLDLKMPDMNGVETLSKLREQCPDVPVYFVTGFHAEFLEPLKELRARGAMFDVARKPLTVAEIRAIAANALSQQMEAMNVSDAG